MLVLQNAARCTTKKFAPPAALEPLRLQPRTASRSSGGPSRRTRITTCCEPDRVGPHFVPGLPHAVSRSFSARCVKRSMTRLCLVSGISGRSVPFIRGRRTCTRRTRLAASSPRRPPVAMQPSSALRGAPLVLAIAIVPFPPWWVGRPPVPAPAAMWRGGISVLHRLDCLRCLAMRSPITPKSCACEGVWGCARLPPSSRGCSLDTSLHGLPIQNKMAVWKPGYCSEYPPEYHRCCGREISVAREAGGGGTPSCGPKIAKTNQSPSASPTPRQPFAAREARRLCGALS